MMMHIKHHSVVLSIWSRFRFVIQHMIQIISNFHHQILSSWQHVLCRLSNIWTNETALGHWSSLTARQYINGYILFNNRHFFECNSIQILNILALCNVAITSRCLLRGSGDAPINATSRNLHFMIQSFQHHVVKTAKHLTSSNRLSLAVKRLQHSRITCSVAIHIPHSHPIHIPFTTYLFLSLQTICYLFDHRFLLIHVSIEQIWRVSDATCMINNVSTKRLDRLYNV